MKRIIQSALACACLLLPGMGWAAIAPDQNANTTGCCSQTLSFTATAGAVIVVSFASDAGSTTTVTYNGATFAELYDASADGAGVTVTACFISVAGADGSAHDISVTSSGNAVGHIIASSWTGVETSSNAAAHRTVYSDGTGAGDFNIAVADSQSGDVVVYAASNFGTDLTAGNTNINTKNNYYTSYDHMQQYASASGSNTAMSVTGGQTGQACAFALVPASAGAATVRNLMTLGVGQ